MSQIIDDDVHTYSNQAEIQIVNIQTQLINNLHQQSNISFDQFKELVDKITINDKFLLQTLTPRGKYFQTLKKLITFTIGLLTLQFLQLIYLFAFDQNQHKNDNQGAKHSNFILHNHNGKVKEQTTFFMQFFSNNLFLNYPTIIVRIIYILLILLSTILIQKLQQYFSNKNLLLLSFSILSINYFIQGTNCNLFSNYETLHFEIDKNTEQVYLDNIIFLSCLGIQGIMSTFIISLLKQHINFMFKTDQIQIFYNDLLLIVIQFFIIASVLHMIFREQYIFTLLCLWIPLQLITIFLFFTLCDQPVQIIKKIRSLEKELLVTDQKVKKLQINPETQMEKILEQKQHLYSCLNTIYQTNHSRKNYYTEDQVYYLIEKYQNNEQEILQSNWRVNFSLYSLSLLFFYQLFHLEQLVSELQWNLDTTCLMVSLFELIGYFVSNYYFHDLYNPKMIKKMLINFGILTFISSIPYFTFQKKFKFQAEIQLFSILVIRIQLYLAIKSFLIKYRYYKQQLCYVIFGVITSLALVFQYEINNLLIAILVLFASQIQLQN